MAILFKDTFTDVDGTALTSHTPDVATNGLVWKMFGTAVAKITGNQSYFTTINSYGPAHVELNLQNFAVQVKYVTVTTLSVLMLRYVDNSNFLGVVKEAETGRITLKKRVTGTFTVLWDSGNLAVVAGDTVRAEHEGTTVRVYINGVLKATVTNVTENLGTMQRVGFASPDATPSAARWDEFQIEDLATDGGSSVAGAAALTGAGTLTASGTVNISGGAALSGSASLTATGIPKIPGAAQLSGTGSLTATGSVTLPGNISGGAALTAAGSLTASGFVLIHGGATLQGTTTLTAAGKKTLRLNPYVGGERTLRLQDMLNIVAMKYPHAYDNEDIVSLINDAQARIFRTIYRVNTATTFDLYADNAFYPIDFTPDNIIDVVVDGKEYPYQNIKYDAQPYYYYVTNGNAIGLYPAPAKDVISGMTVLHYKEPAELSASALSGIPEFDSAWHTIIVYYVCRQLAEIARDTDMVNNFTLEINDIENEYKRSKRAKPHRVQDVYGVGRG